jgi:hypothetical protein
VPRQTPQRIRVEPFLRVWRTDILPTLQPGSGQRSLSEANAFSGSWDKPRVFKVVTIAPILPDAPRPARSCPPVVLLTSTLSQRKAAEKPKSSHCNIGPSSSDGQAFGTRQGRSVDASKSPGDGADDPRSIDSGPKSVLFAALNGRVGTMETRPRLLARYVRGRGSSPPVPTIESVLSLKEGTGIASRASCRLRRRPYEDAPPLRGIFTHLETSLRMPSGGLGS